VFAAVAPLTLIVPPLPEGLLVAKAGLSLTVNVGAGRQDGDFVTEYVATVIGWVSIPTIKVALIGVAWLNDMLLTWQVMMTLKFFVTVIAVKLVKVTVMEIA